ncbi:hypothetical protein O6H91_01G114300 [Diphasiastrum complanatum]|uniref:Uncharacterized protein n=1 Tax=Diphasiastrum complanatum TaxID=34168 RepID=A0ACC2EV29_DIPCM|nr:hypothetical protein O6H91_01G114300 [Diphasiastrum complanatum]
MEEGSKAAKAPAWGHSDSLKFDNEEDEARTAEVTVSALENTLEMENSVAVRKRSLTRSCTLVISSSGQCKAVLGGEDDLQRGTVKQRHQDGGGSEASSTSLMSTFLGTNGSKLLPWFVWLKNQGKQKTIDADETVFAAYHESFLYGKIPFTIKVRTAIRSGFLSQLLMLLELVAALFLVITYVRSTYTPGRHRWITISQELCGSFFVADYALKLYSAPVRLYYIFSVNGLIDLTSVLPMLFLWRDPNRNGSFVQILLILRALRVLPALTSVGLVGSTVGAQIFILTMYTLGVVFIAAGLLQWVEFKSTPKSERTKNQCGPEGCLNFWDAFYFIVVTITTVGYGDVTPKTDWGRLVTLLAIFAAVLILPQQIDSILFLTSLRPYGGHFHVRKVVGSRFIIISGNLSYQTVQCFLSEFYHPCHDKDMLAFPIRVVIMAPFKPTFDLKTLLTFYKGKVEFIEGTPMKDSDLDRVGAKFASAFFLLADEQAKDPDAEDAAQFMRALSVHRHCGSNVRVIVEMLKPENQESAIWDDVEDGVHIICPEAIRFKLLARSCHINGLSTFVINLFRSGLVLRKRVRADWMMQYYDGLKQEVFPVIFPSWFHIQKLHFEQAAEILYVKFQVLLFGLDSTMDDMSRGVLLYPRGRKICSSDVGLVIAKDLCTAEKVSKFVSSSMDAEAPIQFSTLEKAQLPTIVTSTELESGLHAASVSGRTRLDSGLQSRISKIFSSGSSGSRNRKQESHSPENSLDDGSESKKMVCSLVEAIDMAMSWPPLEKSAKPDPAVLEKREALILENLERNTMNVVNLESPHILLCIQGKWPHNLFYFVSHLRTTALHNFPIVILHPKKPTATDWGCVGCFPDVYFVKGSPVYELDLVRGGVLQAEKIVILTQGIQDEQKNDESVLFQPFTFTLDLKNVLIAANVERLLSFQRERVIVELQQELQIQYLRPKFKIDRLPFDPNLYHRNRDASFQFAPPYIQGKGFCPEALTFLLYATFFNRNTVAIVEQLLSTRHILPSEEAEDSAGRRLEQILLPKYYVGRNYCELFVELLKERKMLALGLYRPLGTHGSPVSYVYTNPSPHEELVSGDLVYVLQ